MISALFSVALALPTAPPPEGPLSGLVVYLSAGHGKLLHRRNHDGDPISWGLQRDRTFGVLEDEWTHDFVTYELAPMLEEAGATVLSLRERDRNVDYAIADDRGLWFASRGGSPVADPLAFLGGATTLEPSATAVWHVDVPDAGHWYAYARWSEAPDHDVQATYTTVAAGDVHQVAVDQRFHGGHWYPIAEFCATEAGPVEVWLTGSGAGTLSADAIRVGGGTHLQLVPWDPLVTRVPQHEVAMPHQIEHLGAPDDLHTYECGNPVSDMRLRGHWVRWAHPPSEEAVFLSIHTNAGGGGPGLWVFAGIDTTPPTPPIPESVTIAQSLAETMHGAVSPSFPGYRNNGWKLGDFSEVSPLHNDVPGALIEVAYHDTPSDAAMLRQPLFRTLTARGIVDGLVVWRSLEELPGGDVQGGPTDGEL